MFLLLAMQCCPGLLSVRLINVTNNATMNRLVRAAEIEGSVLGLG